MAKEQHANKTTAQTNLHEQVILDRRLSKLEVSIFITGVLCLFVFGAVFLNNKILKNHTVQMTSRAQSVADWIAASHEVRMRDAGLAPERCQRAKSPLSTCFQDMVSPGQPLEGLKNIYSVDHATAPAFAFVDVPHLGDLLTSCSDLPSPIYISAPGHSWEGRPENWTGVIIIQPATLLDNLSSVANSLSVGYCDRKQRLVWVGSPVSF